jgi:hypothetical protein
MFFLSCSLESEFEVVWIGLVNFANSDTNVDAILISIGTGLPLVVNRHISIQFIRNDIS